MKKEDERKLLFNVGVDVEETGSNKLTMGKVPLKGAPGQDVKTSTSTAQNPFLMQKD